MPRQSQFLDPEVPKRERVLVGLFSGRLTCRGSLSRGSRGRVLFGLSLSSGRRRGILFCLSLSGSVFFGLGLSRCRRRCRRRLCRCGSGGRCGDLGLGWIQTRRLDRCRGLRD